jgi:hypothetical protein
MIVIWTLGSKDITFFVLESTKKREKADGCNQLSPRVEQGGSHAGRMQLVGHHVVAPGETRSALPRREGCLFLVIRISFEMFVDHLVNFKSWK